MSESELAKLRAENESLRQTVADLEMSSKMLVRRDLDLREASDELKHIEQEKNDFISTAAHQLRTPLTSLRFATQLVHESLIDNDHIDPRIRELLVNMRTSVTNGLEAVEGLLTIDHLDYGKFSVELKPTNLELLIDTVLKHFEVEVEDKSLSVIKQYAPSPRSVPLDSGHFSDALTNLLSNAIKYTPHGGSITIRTAYTDDELVLTVADSGIGFTSEEAGRLFRKFYRLDNARRVDANGSGLGLYIVKKIVEQHHGSVRAEPHEGGGASFIVSLPL